MTEFSTELLSTPPSSFGKVDTALRVNAGHGVASGMSQIGVELLSAGFFFVYWRSHGQL